ncbi:unnamed protein product [Triticum turgidum subsp. durum]|uniref:magnesium chelatase n=1 Tax=Triticum turgidum subsp. durum TaxID=4567 RepID=A0A9R1C4V2_TRITD|nr:unnamed protein product [Triticum turgidum subsp. durum]
MAMASPFSPASAAAASPALFSVSTSRPLSLTTAATAAVSARAPCRGSRGFRRGRFAVCNVAAPSAAVQETKPAAAAKESQRPVYPFPAIVGQDEMKLCLLLNVIDPKIGGVMIMGDRGTGKSTTVRSLVDLLPDISVVVGDPFNSDPYDPEVMGPEVRDRLLKGEDLPVTTTKITMVDLPLGATEDRVCGTIDIEKALTEGVKAFEPGLLAKANRGILYVDEITSARSNLGSVQLDHDLRVKISQVCSELNVDGLRGDIVTNRAAKALAALKGRDIVTVEDIATVIPNCLRHRLRKDPLESIDSGLLVVEKFYEVFG